MMMRSPKLVFVLLMLSAISLAQAESKAKAELTRLLKLKAALEKVPMEKQDREPHKSFLKKNEKEIVYSEPAGQWYVQSELFWKLHNKYKSLSIAEQIAWEAAQNPIPGECEGYINCYVYLCSITSGKYLGFYPNGKHSKQAITEVVERLEQLSADDSQYDGPTEAADRAELKKSLAELKQQISGTTIPEKAKAKALITKLETKYK